MKENNVLTASDELVKLFFSQCQSSLEMTEKLITSYRPMLMGQRFLTDSQLSERINISRRTLQDYRDRGKLSFYRLDGKILYAEKDVEKFLMESYRPKYGD